MSRRYIVSDFSTEHKPQADQLRTIAEDCLKLVRANLNNPRELKSYLESYKLIHSMLKESGDDLPTDPVKAVKTEPDISEFE